MVQPTLQKMNLKEVHESFSSNNRGSIHEERRLQIEELDEWQTHKLRTHDKLKLRQNEPDTSPNQLKVGDKVLLDAADPHIVTTTPNEEIPLTVLSIFPFDTVEVSHPKFDTFKVIIIHFVINKLLGTPHTHDILILLPCQCSRCHIQEERKSSYLLQRRGRERPLLRVQPWKFVTLFYSFPEGPRKNFSRYFGPPLIARRCIDWVAVEQVQMADAIQALLTTDPWELFFGIIEPTYLELTMKQCSMFHLQTVMTNYDDPGMEFKEENELHALSRHIHFSPSKCWHTLAPSTTSYNPSRSKALVLPPSLRYLHASSAYMITERRESTGIINTHDVYFLWCMSQRHPYVTRLARHFGLLNTVAQESSLTLISQMSPQDISSMLSMRMIERHRGTYPPQYRLAQSIDEEAYEDIPDDVPPQNEGPPTQPPPPSRPVHATASYADISERLTRFEQ
ncbi:hypothetical protein GOBAR_AA00373 [Gossypium barbadense]|uniref:Uncharacterized protein n=1 Tax=Gossypium barbadense TaxID=3634 RepID=A0A2P5YX53_GOSBA|nr:hypothetical protein GOBAR_AA00373 [Gossypium barbadense]